MQYIIVGLGDRDTFHQPCAWENSAEAGENTIGSEEHGMAQRAVP